MTIKTAIVGATTAIAIAAASVTLPTAASANPFAGLKGAGIETQAAGVEHVKFKNKGKWHKPGHGHHGHHGIHPGAAAAVGVGALIFGAALAGAANAGPRCRYVEVERWSERRQAYVIRTEEVCN